MASSLLFRCARDHGISAQQEPQLDPLEHDEWRWCRFEEALELLYWPENKEALRHCHKILAARGPS